eukprot:scaffold18534_cov67-Phaeocystis_antarctica.AAC.2
MQAATPCIAGDLLRPPRHLPACARRADAARPAGVGRVTAAAPPDGPRPGAPALRCRGSHGSAQHGAGRHGARAVAQGRRGLGSAGEAARARRLQHALRRAVAPPVRLRAEAAATRRGGRAPALSEPGVRRRHAARKHRLVASRIALLVVCIGEIGRVPVPRTGGSKEHGGQGSTQNLVSEEEQVCRSGSDLPRSATVPRCGSHAAPGDAGAGRATHRGCTRVPRVRRAAHDGAAHAVGPLRGSRGDGLPTGAPA